jgi:hypothetical protein
MISSTLQPHLLVIVQMLYLVNVILWMDVWVKMVGMDLTHTDNAPEYLHLTAQNGGSYQ